MKKLKMMLLALTMSTVACCAVGGMVACNPSGGGGGSGSEQSAYTMKITAVGSTTVKEGQTITLRTTVTGTNQKDVTWSSSDDGVATVSERGLVTGVSAGEATITATLKIDSKCKATIKVKIEPAIAPESIEISGLPAENTGWVGETTQLSVNVTPENASTAVDWVSSDPTKAEVSETGVVTYKDKGEVTITATSKRDNTKTHSVTLKVRKGTFLTSKGSANWDFTKQDDETDPHIVISETGERESLQTAYFSNYSGTRFYAEATFKSWSLTDQTWDWQGFGLGLGLSDTDMRYFTYSHHSPVHDGAQNKVIVRDNPNSWGALTQRSQLWGIRGLDSIKLGEDVKIGLLRDGDECYYLVNDEVYYVDLCTKYSGIDTIPMLVTCNIPVTVTGYNLVTNGAEIDEILKGEEYKKSFYAVNGNVDYLSDTEFTLKNVNSDVKFNAARSIGDKAVVMNNFEIEFDVDSIAFGDASKRYKGLTVNMSRFDSADTIEAIGIGKTTDGGDNVVGRFFEWSWPSELDGSALTNWNETTQPVMTDTAAKHHIKITRTVDKDKQEGYFRLFIDGEEYAFDTGRKGATDGVVVKNIGSYIIWVGGHHASGHVTNFTYKSNVAAEEIVNSLAITTEKSSMEVGDTLALAHEFATPAAGATVNYVSLNEGVATVTADGKVKAVASGTAKIMATSVLGNVTVKAIKTITVEEPATLRITNTKTELWPNETLQITYEFSKDTAHTVVFESSDETIATVTDKGVVSPVADGKVTITVKDAVNNAVKATIDIDVITSLRLRIENEEEYIEIGATLQLKYKFSYDAGHSVAFETSDGAKATVSNTGLITANAVGDVVITVKSTTDDSVKATKTFHIVNALTLGITNTETEMWLTGTLQINHEFSYPAGHSVTYEVSDTDKASVSETGLVTAKGLGEITVTINDADSNLTDSITLTIHDIVIDHTYSTDKWDYSGLASGMPTMVTVGEDPDGNDYVAVFKNISAQRYYAEATVKITANKNFVWAGVGLANKEVNSDFTRGIVLSAQTDAANRPLLLQDGYDVWGDLTNASQVHHWKGMASTVSNSSIKLGLVRDGNDYYYFVNGVLVYIDGSDARFDNADTQPVIRLREVHGTVSAMYATTDNAVIDSKLGLGASDKKFASFNSDVVEVKDDGSLAFKNDSLTSIDSNFHVIKDYVAMSAGLKLEGGKDSKVEFDIEMTSFGAGDTGMLGMLLRDMGANQYLSTRAFLIGKSWFGFNGFSFGGNMNVDTSEKTNMPTDIDMTTGTHHVVIERRSTGFTIAIDGNATVASWNYDAYANDMHISFSGTNAAGTISNITVSEI